ncbi:MAG: PAS domain S-box protein [Terracidiphilus sp.]|jgi:PAS domain S-box-containing protein
MEDRKHEESARRYDEEKYRLVLETASDAVVSIDHSGTIQAANPACRRIFAYEPDELIGRPLTILMPEYMRQLHENGFSRYLATGQRHINWQGTELTARRKNGQEFPVEVSFGELTKDGQKAFTGFIRDISERKRAEHALRRSEAFLAEGQHLGQIGSFSWRVATDEITWSAELYRIYEFEIGVPVTHELIRSRVHPEDVSLIEKMNMVDQAREGGLDFEWQYRLLMPDHSIKYMHAVAHATRDQDGQLEYIASVQDVTARRLAEEARDKARSELAHVSRVMSLGTLTASIAHEVNQPLTAVTNNANACLRLLANRALEPEVLRRVLEEIVVDGARASAVIARIRAFLKKKPSEMSEVDINQVIHETVTLASRELSENQIRIEYRLTQPLPFVLADRIQMQQVLLNLIINGIEAMITNDDVPRLLQVESRIDESGDVLIAVCDMGKGLESEPDCVFTPFYTTKSNGMGMGLSISRSLVEGHGGRIWAEPNSPRGSIFNFTLPVAVRSLR